VSGLEAGFVKKKEKMNKTFVIKRIIGKYLNYMSGCMYGCAID
jgi:hypothetical protein